MSLTGASASFDVQRWSRGPGRIDADEVDSLFELVDSRLELSLRLLATPTPKD